MEGSIQSSIPPRLWGLIPTLVEFIVNHQTKGTCTYKMAGQAFNGSSMVAALVAMNTYFKLSEKLRQTQRFLMTT